MFCFFPLFPLKDYFTLDSLCCLWASETIASLLISFNEETRYVNLKGYIRAMNYDKETINQCIRNIFIITAQMTQSWSSLESHFQSERECLRGQVHGVSLAMAGCPSFHIAVFNHAVPSCRNLKLRGHKCTRAKTPVFSSLCALWQITVPKQENLFEGDLRICAHLPRLALKVIPGVWNFAMQSGTTTCMVKASKAVVTLKRSLYLTHQNWETSVLRHLCSLNQQFWGQRDRFSVNSQKLSYVYTF